MTKVTDHKIERVLKTMARKTGGKVVTVKSTRAGKPHLGVIIPVAGAKRQAAA